MEATVHQSPLRRKVRPAVVSPSRPLQTEKSKLPGVSDAETLRDDISVDSNVIDEEFPSTNLQNVMPESIGVEAEPTKVIDEGDKTFNAHIPKTELVFPPKEHEFLDEQGVYTYGVVRETGEERAYWERVGDKKEKDEKEKDEEEKDDSTTDTESTPAAGQKRKMVDSSNTIAAKRSAKVGSTPQKHVSDDEEQENRKRSGRNMIQTQLIETEHYKLETAKAGRVDKKEYLDCFKSKPTVTDNKVHKRLLLQSCSQLLTEDMLPDVLLIKANKNNQLSNNPYLKLHAKKQLLMADSLESLETTTSKVCAYIRPCLWVGRAQLRYTKDTSGMDCTASCNCLEPLVKAAHGIYDAIPKDVCTMITTKMDKLHKRFHVHPTGRSKELLYHHLEVFNPVKNKDVRDGLWAMLGVDVRPTRNSHGIPGGMLPLCLMAIANLIGKAQPELKGTILEERNFSVNFCYGILGGHSKKVKSASDRARGQQDLEMVPTKGVLSTGAWYKQEGYRETLYRGRVFNLTVEYWKHEAGRVLVNEPPTVPPT